MPKVEVSIGPARPNAIEERNIGYGTVSVAEIPVYKETHFSKNFVRTEERMSMDALLVALASLYVTPTHIKRDGTLYTVQSPQMRVGADVRTVMSADDHMTQRMADMDVGLREWAARGGAPALKGKQVTVSVPSLGAADPVTIFEEVKKVAASPQLAAQPTEKYLMVPAAFPALRSLEAKIIIRENGAAGTPAIRFERTTPPEPLDAGLDLLALMCATARDIREATGNPDQTWLVVWFTTLHTAFSLEATRRQIELRQNFPFDRVVVTDGIQFGALEVKR